MKDTPALLALAAKWCSEADTAEIDSLHADSIGLHEAAKSSDAHAKRLRHCATELRALAAPSGGDGDSPEDRFEQYVQDAIARSPEPLRELGRYLADHLDEDEFPRANELILQLAVNTPPQVEYDRDLIADMLETCESCDFTRAAMSEQVRLLRAADNRDALGVHTAKREPQVEGDELAAFEKWARPNYPDPTGEAFSRIEGRPSNKLGYTWEYNGNAVQCAWDAWIERAALTTPGDAEAVGHD